MATESIRPQPGAQEAFLSSTADITIYGGAAGGGKSYALLLEPLRHLGVPRFEAMIFRRESKQVLTPGGLWAEAESVYPLLGGHAKQTALKWEFPHGVSISFGHIEHENDKHKYQGAQIALIGFDELTHFTERQFWYLVSRNRSTCGVRPYIRATCNPDASSFVAKLIAWWIDQDTGIAIPERSGVVRWFVRYGGQLQWADWPDELRHRYPGTEPKSLTFIPATLDDNPALLEKDPGYRANLQSLPLVERERLLGGNWKIVDAEGAEWPPEFFRDIWVDNAPLEYQFSVAALDPSIGDKDRPTATREKDYSAFVSITKGNDNRYYVQASLGRWPTTQIVDHGIDWLCSLRPRPMAFGCEINQFQAMLQTLFEERIERTGLTMTGVFGIHNHEKKIERIRARLSPLLRDGRLRFVKSPGCSLLVEQLQHFPIKAQGIHDDGPDALEMTIRLGLELGNRSEEADEVLVT